MFALETVSKEVSPFESRETAIRKVTPGWAGSASPEVSRSLKHLVVKGKCASLRPPFESVIGRDDRVRILDTELAPWRMICALRMRGANGAGAIGTGWLVGPKP